MDMSSIMPRFEDIKTKGMYKCTYRIQILHWQGSALEV